MQWIIIIALCDSISALSLFFMHITVAAAQAARNVTSESSWIGDVKENVLRIYNCE